MDRTHYNSAVSRGSATALHGAATHQINQPQLFNHVKVNLFLTFQSQAHVHKLLLWDAGHKPPRLLVEKHGAVLR